MKKLLPFILLFIALCCCAVSMLRFPTRLPTVNSVDDLPIEMQSGASAPGGGACANIGRASGDNPFSGWPVARFEGDWRTISSWWCDPGYFRGYTHWGIDIAARTTTSSWDSIDGAVVVATLREDVYGVVIGEAHDGGRHFGMGNHVQIMAVDCAEVCGTAGGPTHPHDDLWVYDLEENAPQCVSGGGTPVPGTPQSRPKDDLLLSCLATDWTATYMHLATTWVQADELITERNFPLGEIDSTGNSTGAHLHYQINHPDAGAIDPAPSMCGGYTDALRDLWRWERTVVCEGGEGE